jgi:hypothetical protein
MVLTSRNPVGEASLEQDLCPRPDHSAETDLKHQTWSWFRAETCSRSSLRNDRERTNGMSFDNEKVNELAYRILGRYDCDRCLHRVC